MINLFTGGFMPTQTASQHPHAARRRHFTPSSQQGDVYFGYSAEQKKEMEERQRALAESLEHTRYIDKKKAQAAAASQTQDK